MKGHAEFKQQGTLNIVGNVIHGIKAGEYITLKNATLNITSAVGDGISCNEYFLMQSGNITISGTGDDGIQWDLDGDTSTGETVNHEDEDSGNMYISGGSINITSTATAAKGIKCAGDMNIGGGTITVTTTGKGTWDEDDLETKAACGLSCDGTAHFEGNCYVSGTVGIENFEMEDIIVRSLNGTIIVEGCEGCEVSIFNMEGRRVSNRGLATGVYLVKVGDYPTRKIVVTR